MSDQENKDTKEQDDKDVEAHRVFLKTQTKTDEGDEGDEPDVEGHKYLPKTTP